MFAFVALSPIATSRFLWRYHTRFVCLMYKQDLSFLEKIDLVCGFAEFLLHYQREHKLHSSAFCLPLHQKIARTVKEHAPSPGVSKAS